MTFNLAESSFIIGIGQATIRAHIDRDWITAYKVGGRWAIEQAELIDYAWAKWEEGLRMNRPESWQGRIDHIISRKRKPAGNTHHRRKEVKR
jgi:hypothetical protein